MSSLYYLPAAQHLLEEEIDFDLKLRGQSVDRRETLQDKKRFLRRLYSEERRSKLVWKGKHLFSDEVPRLEKNVKAIVTSLNKHFDHALVSRLRHYFIRAHSAVVKDDTEKEIQEKFCTQLEDILKSLNQPKMMVDPKEGDSGSDENEEESDEVGDGRGSEDLHQKKSEKKEEDSESDESEEESSKVEKGKDSEDLRQEVDEVEKGKQKQETEENKLVEQDEEEKRKELEAEWKEFILWRQDKLFNEAKARSIFQQSNVDKSGISEKQKVNVDEKPQKGSESRKSQVKDTECSKIEEKKEDRGPPESSKSRKSHKESDKVVSLEGDKRPPESDKSRKSRGSENRDREDRRKRYSSESSVERKKKGSSRSRKKKLSEESEEESDIDKNRKSTRSKKQRESRGRRYRGRSLSSSDSEYDRRRYRKSRVENWDLNFSGDSRSIQVEDFLNRILK